MNPEENGKVLGQWLAKLQSGQLDPAATRKTARFLMALADDPIRQLHGELCDDAEDNEVNEWLRASLADEIPVAKGHPRFDLSFLPRQVWPGSEVGQLWLCDALGAIYIFFNQLIQNWQGQSGLTLAFERTTGGRTPKLLQYSIPATEQLPWEIEISAFTDEGESCRVEIALFQPGAPLADLANIPVELRYAAEAQIVHTDAGGVAEFFGIPRHQLEQITVRITP